MKQLKALGGQNAFPTMLDVAVRERNFRLITQQSVI
jgi:hypothetical protein